MTKKLEKLLVIPFDALNDQDDRIVEEIENAKLPDGFTHVNDVGVLQLQTLNTKMYHHPHKSIFEPPEGRRANSKNCAMKSSEIVSFMSLCSYPSCV